MRKRNIYIYSAIIILTIFQVFLFLMEDKEKVEYEYIGNNTVKIGFQDIDKELSEIDNLEILQLADCGEYWTGKIMITGSSDDIKRSIEMMRDYKVVKYKIDGINNELEVLMDIYR